MITNATLNYNERKGGWDYSQKSRKALKRTLQEMLGIDRWYGTMPIMCMIVWILQKTTDIEEVIAAINKKERKRKRKRKKEQKKKERNAKLRRRNKDREIAYYNEEAEYYREELAYYEEQYDDHHQSHIEEMLNDIRKRQCQRSQPARTARRSRWETEMIVRKVQKEEQATETEIIIYETEQQQEHKIRNDKKRKKITKPNHTVEWIHEWLTLTTQLDGTGGHRQLSKRA